MSHATVLVVGEDVDGQMAPYDEGIVTAPRLEKIPISADSWPGEHIAKQGVDLLDSAAVLAWMVANWSDGRYELRPDGVYQETTYNPDSKWDWYEIGGRWRGMLILKPGRRGVLGRPGVFDNEAMHPGGVDRCRKGDIDWDAMRAAAVAGVEERWDRYEADLAAGKIGPGHAAFVYGVYEGDTRERFRAEAATSFPLSTHAVLAEGVWREVGRMGMFGASSDDESDRLAWADWYRRFMEGLPDEAVLTICDYHI